MTSATTSAPVNVPKPPPSVGAALRVPGHAVLESGDATTYTARCPCGWRFDAHRPHRTRPATVRHAVERHLLATFLASVDLPLHGNVPGLSPGR